MYFERSVSSLTLMHIVCVCVWGENIHTILMCTRLACVQGIRDNIFFVYTDSLMCVQDTRGRYSLRRCSLNMHSALWISAVYIYSTLWISAVYI